MGKKVTMLHSGALTFFFKLISKVEKKTVEKMFDCMLPSHPGKLPLSQMNMMGMGPAMIKKIMKDNNVDSSEDLIKNAIDMGVVSCLFYEYGPYGN